MGEGGRVVMRLVDVADDWETLLPMSGYFIFRTGTKFDCVNILGGFS